MPDQKTRADSLRLYLSGAASDGAAQTDPNAALGGFRSSTLCVYFDVVVTNPISNVTINHVSGANAEGSGTITALSTSTLAWTPPGGAQGPAVSIANGETKILEGSGQPGQFVRVTRTSATDLTGAATLALTYKYNDVTGFDDVSSAEAGAGDVEYRAMFIYNESASEVKNVKVYLNLLGTSQVSAAAQLGSSGSGSITLSVGTFNDWPDSGFCRIETSGGTLREIVYYSSRTSTTLTVPSAGRGLLGTSAAAGGATDVVMAVPGIRVAKEAPVADEIQTIADENTAPTGVTWSSAVTKATGVDVSDMAAGDLYGVWMQRVVTVGAVSEAEVLQSLAIAFDAA